MKISNLDPWVRQTEGLPVLDRAEIEALQLKKLNALLHKLHGQSRFYVSLPPELPCLEALADLPFTTEADLAKNGGRMLLLSQSEILRVHTFTTSGTTGAAKRVFYTREDCETTVFFFAAGLSELVFPGSKTMICMPFSGPYGLGELISEAVEALGAEPLKTGAGRTYGELREILEAERPDTFVGMPAPLLAMVKYCGAGSLRRALVSADACVPAVMGGIEGRLGTRLFPHYGSREMVMGGAVTCPAHQGMHLRENHIIAEIVDEGGNPLPAGAWGELVITTVGMVAMPLIRYRTGDHTRIIPEPCPCGSALLRLDAVTRRDAGAAGILALDEALLGLDALVDYAARASEDAVYIEALTLGQGDAGEIEAAARRALGGQSLHISARPCQDGDRPLYPGKRRIITS